MNKDNQHDYLAVIWLSSGAGSYCRSHNYDEAVKGVTRLFRSDFRGIIKIKKGYKVSINVVDVQGHDEVWWDETGFYDGKEQLNRPIQKVSHVY